LRAAAHGAMVVDELQSSRPRDKTEMAAARPRKHASISCVPLMGRILL